jgi:DNA-binding MarR family transcriptional regulator
LPQGAKLVYAAIAARAFGSKPVVCCGSEVIGNDLGVSRQTVQKHVNILEAFHFIKRNRRGQNLTSVIILTLKEKLGRTARNVSEAISKSLAFIRQDAFKEGKLTVKECLELWFRHKTAHAPML